VTLYPLILMDVPAGNALPDPSHRGQPAGLSLARPHHLRPGAGGRRARRTDGAAAAQVAAFAGGTGWDYRRMVLHYAG
jgi:hypothetical protein